MKTFTEDKVIDILVATMIFANANNNQGLQNVSGLNYGERAKTIINAYNNYLSSDNSGITNMIKDFTK